MTGRLRALMWTPTFAGTPEGGHRIQMAKTVQALRDTRRVDVDVIEREDPEFSRYDVVHSLGLTPQQARRARNSGKPLLLSTIYCSKRFHVRGPQNSTLWQETVFRLRGAAGAAVAGLQGRSLEKAERTAEWVTSTRAVLEMADVLLPNSDSEARALRTELGVTTPMRVVPNATDPGFLVGDPPGGRRGVLMVGRFEPHKNQLSLIRACRPLGVPLTLVGPLHPDHERYLRRCRREAGTQVTIIPAREQRELRELYSRAVVHALPSYFETTGLVSLEAALAGCRIVTTNAGHARDYFGDEAHYCSPRQVDSIREAVAGALMSDASAALTDRILARFTWRNAAEETLDAYEEALGGREGRADSLVAPGCPRF